MPALLAALARANEPRQQLAVLLPNHKRVDVKADSGFALRDGGIFCCLGPGRGFQSRRRAGGRAAQRRYLRFIRVPRP